MFDAKTVKWRKSKTEQDVTFVPAFAGNIQKSIDNPIQPTPPSPGAESEETGPTIVDLDRDVSEVENNPLPAKKRQVAPTPATGIAPQATRAKGGEYSSHRLVDFVAKQKAEIDDLLENVEASHFEDRASLADAAALLDDMVASLAKAEVQHKDASDALGKMKNIIIEASHGLGQTIAQSDPEIGRFVSKVPLLKIEFSRYLSEVKIAATHAEKLFTPTSTPADLEQSTKEFGAAMRYATEKSRQLDEIAESMRNLTDTLLRACKTLLAAAGAPNELYPDKQFQDAAALANRWYTCTVEVEAAAKEARDALAAPKALYSDVLESDFTTEPLRLGDTLFYPIGFGDKAAEKIATLAREAETQAGLYADFAKRAPHEKDRDKIKEWLTSATTALKTARATAQKAEFQLKFSESKAPASTTAAGTPRGPAPHVVSIRASALANENAIKRLDESRAALADVVAEREPGAFLASIGKLRMTW